MANEAVQAVITATGGRRLADGEWGLRIDDVGGSAWPLDVGVRLRRGVLRAQAFVVPAGVVDGHELLVRNRGLLLVRFTHTGSGDVWLAGELLAEHVSAASVDRLLGLLVQAAGDLRAAVASSSRA